MFARKVAALLALDSLTEFTNLMESEILPWLRRQKGFLDLIILAVPNSREVATISFWEHQENAQAYNATGYPEVLQKLAKLLDSVPYVKTFEVVASTFQNLALERSPAMNNPAQETGSAQSGSAQSGSAQSGSAQSSYRSCQTSA